MGFLLPLWLVTVGVIALPILYALALANGAFPTQDVTNGLQQYLLFVYLLFQIWLHKHLQSMILMTHLELTRIYILVE